MKAYLVDAYDSFVHIIRQYILGMGIDSRVVRNDDVDFADIKRWAPDFILLGPGPGHPADARYVELIRQCEGKIPILGVCLGHQAIGLAYGGKIVQATSLKHGKTSQIDHDGKGVFTGQPNPFRATRYHSLIIEEQEGPSVLEVTARALDDGYVMGLRHKVLPIESVQFHPESVYTQDGIRLFHNFVATHVARNWKTP